MNKNMVLIMLLSILSVVFASEITSLKNNCYPCTGFGFSFCKDDPNLVNLNKNKCYQSQEDKLEFCNGFDLISNYLLCEPVNITISEEQSCIDMLPQNFKYNKPWRGELTLKPFTSCRFFLKRYSAYFDATWDFPMTLYRRDYKTAKYSDASFLVKESDENGKYAGNKCFENTCDAHFYVTYGQ